MNISRSSIWGGASLLASFAIFTVACSDDDVTSAPPVGATNPTVEGGATGSTKPLYALQSLIFSTSGSTTYVSLLETMDTQAKVALAGAREFAGYAAANAIDGKMFVNDGETPKITRFALGEDKSWTEEGQLSFSNFTNASLTASIVSKGTQAFAPFDATSYVTWNPATMALGAELPDPAQVPITKNGLNAQRGYARPTVGKYSFQPFYWADPTFAKLDGSSQIAILDPATNTWVAAPEVACPHMHIATTDDAGNVYFSPGVYSIAPAVVDATFARNCMVRIKAGETTIDPTFTVKFNTLTDGREGSNFFYIGNNVGFFNVYHKELDAPEVSSDPTKIAYSTKFHIWTLDMNTMKAAPMEGIDYGGGQYVAFRIDNRAFVAQPAPDYSSTAIFEVTSAGKAEKRFDVEGWMFNMFKVR